MSKSADWYLDSKLVARKPVTLHQSPNDTAPVLKKFAQGENVGMIQSWVVRDGQVWWEVNWFSGKHAGWIKHVPGLFDEEIVEQTASGKAHEENVKRLNEIANSDTDPWDFLSNIGNYLKYLIIIALVLGLIFFFLPNIVTAFKS